MKSYNEENGFAFIGRVGGSGNLIAQKKEFGDPVPYAGMGVSFKMESTEKEDAAKKSV